MSPIEVVVQLHVKGVTKKSTKSLAPDFFKFPETAEAWGTEDAGCK